MADERDIELLDDYLTNRMSEQERSAFEKRLQADPDLQNEYRLQQRLVKGIRDARVAELKSMLNKIPVSATSPRKTIATKILIGTILSVLIATAAYMYFNKDEIKIAQTEAPVEERTTEENTIQPDVEELKTPAESEKRNETPAEPKDKNQTSAGTEQSKPSQAKKPAPLKAPQEKTNQDDGVESTDPAEESSRDAETDHPDASGPGKSSFIIETDTDNGDYDFHYQFNEGKLILYGPFEKNLYEVMEFSNDGQPGAFLFYNNKYYLLDEDDLHVKPLIPIADAALLRQLKEFRSAQ